MYDTLEPLGLNPCKVLKKTLVDLQKRFPIYNACLTCLAAYRCGWAFPQNGLAFRTDLEKVEVTPVDWERGIVHCVLIQHLKNLSKNHSYN